MVGGEEEVDLGAPVDGGAEVVLEVDSKGAFGAGPTIGETPDALSLCLNSVAVVFLLEIIPLVFYEFALNERTRARVDEHARVVLSARFEEALELSKLSHLILAVCGMNAAVMLYAMDLGWSIHVGDIVGPWADGLFPSVLANGAMDGADAVRVGPMVAVAVRIIPDAILDGRGSACAITDLQGELLVNWLQCAVWVLVSLYFTGC